MKLLIADCGLRIADCVLRHGSWPVRRSERNRELPMNRLVTGNLSLVTGDLEKLIPNVKPFSISSYQLPVTSYQLPVTSLSGSWSQCVAKSKAAPHEPSVAQAPMANEQ